jgi:PAS domain S-box-containing protein
MQGSGVMSFSRLRRFVPIAIPMLALGIFLVDLATPVGVAHWVLYFIPLILSFYSGGRYSPFLLAGVFSVLTILGFYWSPPGLDLETATINLVLGICTLWGVAALLFRLRRTADEARGLSRAVEQSPASVVITDLAGNITYVNPKFCELTGYALEEVLGKNPRFLKSGEMPREAYQQLWNKILAGGEWRGTFHNRKKSGELFWEMASIGPVYNESGKITHLLAVKEDITERKKAEDALRESELQYRSLFANMLEGFVCCQLIYQDGYPVDFIYLSVNKSFERISGLKDVVGKKVSEVLPGFKESRPVFFEVYGRVDATGQPERLEMNLVSSGAWVDMSVYSLAKGRIATAFTDITERKQAAVALQESEQRYRKLVQSSPDAIFIQCEHKVVYINDAGLKLLGATRSEQVLGRPFLDFIHTPHRDVVKARMIGLTERLEHAPMLKEQYLRLDGSVVDVEVTAIPFTFNGKPGAQVVVRDIADRTKLECQVLQLQRMESLGMLAGGIAHDLNNVLTPLLFSVEVLKHKVTDPDGRQLLEMLETNVLRGAGLVKQVLTFGRGVAGDRIPLSPGRVVREIRHIIQETFPKSIKFKDQAAPDLWNIIGDSTQLHQVLLNLVVNARDAMPSGGELSVKLRNVMLDESYTAMNLDAKAGPYVIITVADTGMGIPKEIRDRIYDPFFTTKEVGKGSGLGLSTTLGIIKSHGGFIHCYSEVGSGTAFNVYLPANPAPAARNEAPAPAQLPRGQNELVLVVDDEIAIRQVARRALEQFGYRVALAENGADAVAFHARHQQEIAVVITDMTMPIMDGPAIIVALRTINPQVKIISSSGLATNGSVAKAAESGVKHFIPKPYDAESMLNAVRGVLG